MRIGTIGQIIRKKIKTLLIVAPTLVLVLFYVFPNLFYYTAIVMLNGSTNVSYFAAQEIGHNGSIFFLRRGVNSMFPEVRDLMATTGIEAYLTEYGGTEEIWELIVEQVKNKQKFTNYLPTAPSALQGYIYGGMEYDERGRRVAWKHYFSVDKILWANEHLYDRPPDHYLIKMQNSVEP